jgi:hypothetical protein
VNRNEDGKEVRYPVILSPAEKEIARKVKHARGPMTLIARIMKHPHGSMP